MRTRRTQLYRRGATRPPGAAFDAMLAGRARYLGNPQDLRRYLLRRNRPPLHRMVSLQMRRLS